MVVPRFARELMTRYRLVPAQSPDAGTPYKDQSINELREELRCSLQEMKALFEVNPRLDYRAMIHQHPLMGVNNAVQLLRIVARHGQRHQSQISDLLRHLGFPRAA
jgi:uncharacterized damage-inducible protein DinB